MCQLKLLLIGLTAVCAVLAQGDKKQIICYLGSWAHYRLGVGAFKAEDIDPIYCTILIYAFVGIDENGYIKHLDPWLDRDLGYLSKIRALKGKNPALRVELATGGWNEGSAKYSAMAASSTKRKNFIDSAVKMIQEFGFDGLDLDWEYPTRRDGATPQDRENFVQLLKEMRQAFKPFNFILTTAVGASPELAESAYDIASIAKYIDYVNLMNYDYHTAEERLAGSNAPLEGPGPNNVKASVEYWLSHGFPAHKLIMGLPFYGRTYRLADSAQHELGSPTIGAGAPGPYTQQGGFLGYNEICVNIKKFTRVWSDKEKSAYLFNQNDFISYDDPQSIGEKVAYAISKDLGGVMAWSMETDDFRGLCGTKYPLLKTINNGLGNPQNMSSSGNELPQETSSSDQTHPSETSNNPGLGQPINCSVDGFYPNKDDCSAYIRCVGGIPHNQICPSGLHFDRVTNNCNWPNEAKCQ